jgi:hypothetical protein
MTLRRSSAIALATAAALALVTASISAVGRASRTPRREAHTAGRSAHTSGRSPHTSARSPHTSAAFATGATITRMRGSCRWRRFADGAIGPDPRCAPGHLDRAVTGRVAQTICRPAWVAAASKPSPSARTRDRLLIDYSLPGNPATYAIARVVPVQDGGSPTGPGNLYPLPVDGFGSEQTRAQVADDLHDRICSHEITLAQAAHTLEGDWLSRGLPDDD